MFSCIFVKLILYKVTFQYDSHIYQPVLTFFMAFSSIPVPATSAFLFLCSFFSLAVFFKPFIFLVCNLSVFCFGMCICPCRVPNASFETFLTFLTCCKDSHVYIIIYDITVCCYISIIENIHNASVY